MQVHASKKAVANFVEVLMVHFAYSTKDKRLRKVMKRKYIFSLDGSIPMLFSYMKLETIWISVFLSVK